MTRHKALENAFKNITRFSRKYTTDGLYFSIGSLIGLPGLLIYLIITIPAIIYRFIISTILSKRSSVCRDYSNLVSVGFSTAYAAEYLSSVSNSTPSRNTVLAKIIFENHIPFQELFLKVKSNWIYVKRGDDKNNASKEQWKYPEFRQYVDSWMGYAYWRQDNHFNVDKHLKFHHVSECVDLNKWTSTFCEDLYNQPFCLNVSPWEVHVIHGWMDSEIFPQSTNNNDGGNERKVKVTITIIRTHHVLGDGGTIMTLIMEDLLGYRLEDFQQMYNASLLLPKKEKESSLKKAIVILGNAIKLTRDFGCILMFAVWNVTMQTRFHACIDKHKNSYLILETTSLIPVDTVKCIKKRCGGSFGGVILSSVAAAMSSCSSEKCSDHVILAAPRPFPGRYKGKLENHLTFTAYNIPIKPEMISMDRLQECDQRFRIVNQSLFSLYIFPSLVNLLSCHILPIAKLGFTSTFGVSLSNNLGPPVPLYLEGRHKILEISGGSSTFDGFTGIMFTLVSYNNQLRLQAVAETCSVNKRELKTIMDRFVEEINCLDEMKLN